MFYFYCFGDSSSSLRIVAGSLILLVFCEDSSSTVSKVGFVLHFMDSSIVFLIVVLSTVSEQIRLL